MTRKAKIPFLALLLLFATATPAHAGNDEIKCDADAKLNFTNYFSEADANKACHNVPYSECKTPIETVGRSSIELMKYLQAICGSVGRLNDEIAAVSGQSTSNAETARIYGRLLGDYTAFISLMESKYGLIHDTLVPHDSPLGAPRAMNVFASLNDHQKEQQLIRAALDSPQKMANLPPVKPPRTHSEITGTADEKEQARLFAGRNSAAFMQLILKQKSEAEVVARKVAALKAQAEAAANGLKPPDQQTPRGPAGPAGPAAVAGGGLDLKNLAALAAAGAGLAQMMKKPNQPTEDPAAATSPTPSSPNNSQKKEPDVAKFGGESKTPSGPVVGGPTKKPDDNGTARVPSAPGWRENSDISKSKELSFAANGAAAPATAKAGGNGGGGGGGGASGAPEAPATAKHDPAAAGEHPPTDEMQGIGGGGLGGGGPPGGASAPSMPAMPTDPGAAGVTPEESMKDLLHEMKETAEGGAPPLEGEVGAAPEIPMSDEDLFPRVRACYVRILKQGRVLDGLGEKIDPENP